MLPKLIYEPLPYAYIATAIVVVLFAEPGWAYLGAALLYCCGAVVWVKRSANRRRTSPARVKNRQGFVLFPTLIYEYLPFVYLATGLAVLTLVALPWNLIPGAVLCLAGALVWLIRAIYRAQPNFRVHA